MRAELKAPDELVLGRPASEIIASLPDRIGDPVREWARRMPDAPALVDRGRTWTYAELGGAVDDARALLTDAGVRPGDRVLIVNENCRNLVACLLALSGMDAWAVIVNARLSRPEIEAIRDHCRPRRLLYTVDVSDEAAALAERDDAAIQQAGRLDPIAVSALHEADPEPVRSRGAEQVAALIYTSGTTGTPKGVMLSHRGILFVAAISGGLRQVAPGDRVYGVLPISHVFGLASVCMGALYAGACLHLSARFDPAQVLHALSDDQVTMLQGVPAMFSRLLEHVRGNDIAIAAPRLRFISAGGSPLDPAVKQRVEAAFGLPLHNGYGLTESSPTISQTRIDTPPTDCAAGRVLPGLAVRLLDREGREVPAGDVGELWVRGANVMLGYYRSAEASGQVMTADGWLDTGDLARLDADANLSIAGRSKELIIHSGFNVYPPDVEAVLNAHPAVTLSAVVGRRVEGNEEIIAFVQLAPGNDTSVDALRAFAAEHLAPYKRPHRIVTMPALPATATGKILKGRLKHLADRMT